MTNKDPNIQEEHRAGHPQDGSDGPTLEKPGKARLSDRRVDPGLPTFNTDESSVVYEPMTVPELPPVEAFMYGEPAPAWRHPFAQKEVEGTRRCEHHACRCAAAARLAAMGLTQEAIEAHSRAVPCMEPAP